MPLLEVRNLRVEFPTRRGTLVAVDDVSFHIDEGEVLGVVGESGAGKSITGVSIIRLIEPPGRIAGGEVLLKGRRIDNIPLEEMRHVRGKEIGAIFQDHAQAGQFIADAVALGVILLGAGTAAQLDEQLDQ